MLEFIFYALLTLAALYAVFKIIDSRADTVTKVLWTVGVLIFPFVGVVAWYFFGPGGGRR